MPCGITGFVNWDGAARGDRRLDLVTLRMADWAIRHFTPAGVEHWLDLAEQRMT